MKSRPTGSQIPRYSDSLERTGRHLFAVSRVLEGQPSERDPDSKQWPTTHNKASEVYSRAKENKAHDRQDMWQLIGTPD